MHPNRSAPNSLANSTRGIIPRFWRAVVVLAVVGAAYLLAHTGLESLFYPWAHSVLWGPTLTGTWYGELSVDGTPNVVRLDMEPRLGRRPGKITIGGTLVVCDPDGHARTFTVWGGTSNWRGTLFGVSVAAQPRIDHTGVEPRRLEGRWSGDVIRAAVATHNVDVRSGIAFATAGATRETRSISSDSPNEEIVLRRGDDGKRQANCYDVQTAIRRIQLSE